MKLYTEEQLKEYLSSLGNSLGTGMSDEAIKDFIGVSKIEINDNVINHVMNDDTIEKLVLCETGHDIKRYNNGK